MRPFIRILFLFSLIGLASCKKDHSVLGVDVQPAGDALHTTFTDTTQVYALTVGNDSTLSANKQYKFLGSNLDPYLGRMDVGINMNLNMNLTNLDFGGDANIVSSEIILVVNDLYYVGDPSAKLTYSVFALDSTMSTSRLYYTNNTHLYNKGALLSTYTTSFTVYNGKPVIRIPISNAYAGAMLTSPQFLTSNDVFQSVYKGFYVTASIPNDRFTGRSAGIIYQCDLEDADSGFYLYYQNGTPSATRQDKSFQFAFAGTSAQRFNTVKYFPTQGGTSNLIQQVVNRDSAAGKQNLYLRGLGVTKVKVRIPALSHFADSSRISVNRAELIFNVDPSFMPAVGQYTVPPRLSLLPMDSLSRETYALDQVDPARYDGTYDAANNRYVFNIARHVEAIAQGKLKNYGFYLVIADTQVLYSIVYNSPSKEMLAVQRGDFIERVVLAGSDQGALRPKLNITYVKLKK